VSHEISIAVRCDDKGEWYADVHTSLKNIKAEEAGKAFGVLAMACLRAAQRCRESLAAAAPEDHADTVRRIFEEGAALGRTAEIKPHEGSSRTQFLGEVRP